MFRAALLFIILSLASSNDATSESQSNTYSMTSMLNAGEKSANEAGLSVSDAKQGHENPTLEGKADSAADVPAQDKIDRSESPAMRQTVPGEEPRPLESAVESPNGNEDERRNDQYAYSMTRAVKPQPSFGDKLREVDWGTASDDMVRGLIHAFFNKAVLQDSEKKCLRSQIGGFVGDITSLATDAVKALKPVFNQSSSETKAPKSLMPFLMDGVVKITDLVAVTSSLLKTCVQGDGLLLLNNTAKHLSNFSYLGDRLLVNGIDIAKAIAQGTIEFENEHWYEFGEQIGIALRKVLLSTATSNLVLPEGYPRDAIIAQCTEGIAAGFFAPGSDLIITDVNEPDVKVDIDLNSCVVRNHQIFRDVFEAFWILIAQFVANKDQHQLGAPTPQQGQPQWVNELLKALVQIPSALTKCSVMSAESEEMWQEALQAFGSIRFHFKFPDDKIKAEKATKEVALAVEFFAKHQYKLFGKELGKLFRELLLLAFPQKYSVGSSGRLRKNLISELAASDENQKVTGEQICAYRLCVTGLAPKGARSVLVVGGVAFALLMSLVAFKTLRVASTWRHSDRTLVDVEEGRDTDALELLE